MTCLEASEVSRFVPQTRFFTGLAGWLALAQSLPSRPKSWLDGDVRLPAGRALTLQARQAGVLRIMQGRVWITFSHADQDLRVRAGDHFCSAGERLPLSAGDTVVMEPWGKKERRDAPARFLWEPATMVRVLAQTR